MSKSTLAISLLILTLPFLASCGAGAKATSEAAPESEESKEEREKRAAMLYQRYKTAEYAEKVQGLTEVARTFWDTPTGPLAARDLVLYLLDEPGDDPATALAEVRRLRKRRPDSEEVMTSAMLLTYALQKRLLQDDVDPKREVREKLFAEARKLFVEIGEDFCNRPEFSQRADMHLEWGNSYMLVGEFAKAEDAWSRVETFAEKPPAMARVTLLVKRANILREKLDALERSLKLFRQADGLLGEIEDISPVLEEHIASAIVDLEEKVRR